MDLRCQGDQGVYKKVCRHGWEAVDRKQMIEKSQLLVFRGFDEKNGLKTLHGNFIGTKGVGLQTMDLGFFPAERKRGREKGKK